MHIYKRNFLPGNKSRKTLYAHPRFCNDRPHKSNLRVKSIPNLSKRTRIWKIYDTVFPIGKNDITHPGATDPRAQPLMTLTKFAEIRWFDWHARLALWPHLIPVDPNSRELCTPAVMSAVEESNVEGHVEEALHRRGGCVLKALSLMRVVLFAPAVMPPNAIVSYVHLFGWDRRGKNGKRCCVEDVFVIRYDAAVLIV